MLPACRKVRLWHDATHSCQPYGHAQLLPLRIDLASSRPTARRCSTTDVDAFTSARLYTAHESAHWLQPASGLLWRRTHEETHPDGTRHHPGPHRLPFPQPVRDLRCRQLPAEG